MINVAAVYHEAKSKYAYAYDESKIHIRIRCAKGDVDSVNIIYGDPFNWGQNDLGVHTWIQENKPNEKLHKEYTTELHDYFFIELTPRHKRIKYAFILKKGDEKLFFGPRYITEYNPDKQIDLFNFFNFPYMNSIDVYTCPSWVKDTIWYQIFPERFCNGDKTNDPKNVRNWNDTTEVTNEMFFGGDLEGVIKKLDYLQDLGINGIYFTPIFKSPTTHKYDIEDYFSIDPHFGDLETFKTLVKEAHKRGIRIMLDAVFNHCGFNHPFFQDVVKYGENSPYKDYFHIHSFPVLENDPKEFRYIPGKSTLNYETFAFTPFMPKWNTENPQVKEYLLKVAKFWIEECDIDAWRLDVSNEVDHEFWRSFRKVCDSAKKDFYIVGENWDDSNPWLKSDQMHAVMNYNFTYPCWSFFGKKEFNNKQFIEAISNMQVMYPKNILPNLYNLLDSHDTTRIITMCNENIQSAILAYVFLFTISGSPSIYYGGEIGLSGGHDPLNRRCMIWDKDKQNLQLLEIIKKLISLRKQHPSFKAVDIKFYHVDNDDVLVYEKETLEEKIVIVLNNGNENQSIKLPHLNCTLLDIFNNKEIKINEKVDLKPYEFYILKY